MPGIATLFCALVFIAGVCYPVASLTSSLARVGSARISSSSSSSSSCTTSTSLCAIFGGDDDDADRIREMKGMRRSQIGDRVVELKRPLGIELNEDDRGNVYIESELF